MSLVRLSLALLATADRCKSLWDETKTPALAGVFVIIQSMKDFLFLMLGLVIIIGSIFVFFERTLDEETRIKLIKINGTSVSAEIADSPETRAKGLSGREVLKDGTGMFFVFDDPGSYGFWMKDMNFAIDIAWIDADLRVIGVVKGVSPDTFPQIFYPDQAVKYVLELPAGFTDKYPVDMGAVIQ